MATYSMNPAIRLDLVNEDEKAVVCIDDLSKESIRNLYVEVAKLGSIADMAVLISLGYEISQELFLNILEPVNPGEHAGTEVLRVAANNQRADMCAFLTMSRYDFKNEIDIRRRYKFFFQNTEMSIPFNDSLIPQLLSLIPYTIEESLTALVHCGSVELIKSYILYDKVSQEIIGGKDNGVMQLKHLAQTSLLYLAAKHGYLEMFNYLSHQFITDVCQLGSVPISDINPVITPDDDTIVAAYVSQMPIINWVLNKYIQINPADKARELLHRLLCVDAYYGRFITISQELVTRVKSFDHRAFSKLFAHSMASTRSWGDCLSFLVQLSGWVILPQINAELQTYLLAYLVKTHCSTVSELEVFLTQLWTKVYPNVLCIEDLLPAAILSINDWKTKVNWTLSFYKNTVMYGRAHGAMNNQLEEDGVLCRAVQEVAVQMAQLHGRQSTWMKSYADLLISENMKLSKTDYNICINSRIWYLIYQCMHSCINLNCMVDVNILLSAFIKGINISVMELSRSTEHSALTHVIYMVITIINIVESSIPKNIEFSIRKTLQSLSECIIECCSRLQCKRTRDNTGLYLLFDTDASVHVFDIDSFLSMATMNADVRFNLDQLCRIASWGNVELFKKAMSKSPVLLNVHDVSRVIRSIAISGSCALLNYFLDTYEYPFFKEGDKWYISIIRTILGEYGSFHMINLFFSRWPNPDSIHV